jgi:hypothetical protein
MRLAILILPFLLAANPVSAEHDRHHRSVPRVKAEVRVEAVLNAQPAVQSIVPPAPVATTADERKPERRPVRVVLPSPFAQ